MQSLEPRIAALEKASPAPDGLVLIRRFVKPGHLDAEIYCLRSDAGERWERLPGEPEQAFIDRASREVRRNEWGFAGLTSEVPC